jgi:cell division protein FtsW (lipid II flippase)
MNSIMYLIASDQTQRNLLPEAQSDFIYKIELEKMLYVTFLLLVLICAFMMYRKRKTK